MSSSIFAGHCRPEKRLRKSNQHGTTRSASSLTSCPPDASPPPLIVAQNICTQRCELQRRRRRCQVVPILHIIVALRVCNGRTAGERTASGESAKHGSTSGSSIRLLLLRREIHQRRELVPPLGARGKRAPALPQDSCFRCALSSLPQLCWIWLWIHRGEVTWGGFEQLAQVQGVVPKLT